VTFTSVARELCKERLAFPALRCICDHLEDSYVMEDIRWILSGVCENGTGLKQLRIGTRGGLFRTYSYYLSIPTKYGKFLDSLRDYKLLKK